MQRNRMIVALLVGLLGVFWIGQGVGLLPGSLMSGQTFWALAGVVVLGVAVVLAWRARARG